MSYTENISIKSVQIHKGIDASIRESLHTCVVVGMSINMIDPNGICSQSIHKLCILLTLGTVRQRIVLRKLISNPYKL